MDWQNLLKVAVAVALGVATCTLVALQGHTQNSAGRQLSWEDAVPGVPTWPLVCILGGLTAVAMRWLYKLLFCPLELLRAPEDVGYIAEDGRSKAQAANQVRRRRKTGELPPVYPNGWFRVLDSHLLHRGEVRNASVLGEQVAVFRGHSGEAHVVDAYCPHLGANLAVGGRVLGDCIECPFHGWQFQGSDGKCVRIPYAEKRNRDPFDSLVPEIAKVHRWPSCEVNGLILVWFHCEGKEPEWTVPEQEEIASGKWVYRGRTEHFINAHIQEIPENAADLAHLGHLHTPSITSGVDLRHINSKTWQFLRHDWKVRWEPEPEPNQHCSQMFVRHSLTVFGLRCSLLDVHVVARQVGPGLVFLLFNHAFLGRGLLVHCVTPVEPLLQCVTHTMFYQSNMLPLVPKFILRAESIQFERDVMVWNNKRYVSKPLLVKEDQAIQKHRRWFSQFYSESSPRLKLRRHTLDF